jgi:hypothetical protein
VTDKEDETFTTIPSDCRRSFPVLPFRCIRVLHIGEYMGGKLLGSVLPAIPDESVPLFILRGKYTWGRYRLAFVD